MNERPSFVEPTAQPASIRPLRLLLLESDKIYAQQLLDYLSTVSFDITSLIITTETNLKTALTQKWDIIIADYALALPGLKIVREQLPDLPFIVLTNIPGEIPAIESLKAGANECIPKHNLRKIVAAIEREINLYHNRLNLPYTNIQFSEQQNLLLRISDLLPLAVFIFDIERKQLSWLNQGVEELTGYTQAQCKAMTNVAALIHPEDQWLILEVYNYLNLTNERNFYENECRIRHKSDEWRWVFFRVVSFRKNTAGKCTQVLAVAQDIQDRKKLEAEQKQRQAVILTAVLEAQEQERRRIAGELHDSIAQQILAVLLHFNALQDYRHKKEKENEAIDTFEAQAWEQIGQMLRDTIDEIRTTSHNLMPRSISTGGLDQALRRLTAQMQATHTTQINYNAYHVQFPLPEAIEIGIYRIVQESLANALKHSEANQIDIQLIQHPTHLSLSIEDDGKGFDTNTLTAQKGIGLSNLEARVRLLSGTLVIESIPGKGTTILVELPYSQSDFS
jgi:two-component system sensor histidine kinase UhpB